MATLSENIKRLRKEAKMTQDDLADEAGVNRVTLSKYESGEVAPGAKVIMRLAAALHVRPDVLLGTEEYEMTDEERELWDMREAARRDPERHVLFKMAKDASIEDIRQVNALIHALRATNPDFYDGDDPS